MQFPLLTALSISTLSPMSLNYTPDHLRPRELWRLRLDDGRIAYALLSPTVAKCAVVWYLDGKLQDAAEFDERTLAEHWARDARAMLLATTRV